MKLYATDTLHLSEVSQHSLLPGQEFEVSDETAKELIERGLARKAKAEQPLANKMEEAPANKSKSRG